MTTSEEIPADPRVRDATADLLGEPRVLTREQVCDLAGVTPEEAAKFWRALGLPRVGQGGWTFTDADVDALRGAYDLIRGGEIDEPVVMSMTRAVARTADRLAIWQSSLLVDAFVQGDDAQAHHVDDLADLVHNTLSSGAATHAHDAVAASREAAARLVAAADRLEPLLVYAWRRHLAATVNRMFAAGEGAEDGVRQTVGFADMVGFTTLVTRLSDRRLATLVRTFEELVADIVTSHRGRVVKTIGDEVFFAAPCPVTGVSIALDILDAMAQDASMPSMRVGLASGHVHVHLGDLFGTTVNRASRISEVAGPGLVLVDDPTAVVLQDRGGFGLRRLEPQHLRGLGPTGMWSVTRA